MSEYATSTITISRANWTKIPKESPAGSRHSAVFTCPICGTQEALYNHDVLSDGKVIPSVSCSSHCGFHADIVLEGWD